ncbi:transposase, partial [Candidatus Bipolaricaulota bacterium]|nr:transposase [Candidatus Bipolaricaulota bacterium]
NIWRITAVKTCLSTLASSLVCPSFTDLTDCDRLLIILRGYRLTDESRSHEAATRAYIHRAVRHSKTFVNGNVHTIAGNFWSLLKWTVIDVYNRVSPKYLQAYPDEIVFRFNSRHNEGIF